MKKLVYKTKLKKVRHEADLSRIKKSIMYGFQLSEPDIKNLIQELEESRDALKEVNSEIMLAKEKAEMAATKFAELYDFSPSGFYTLSQDGRILELNLQGSRMFCSEKSKLQNTIFSDYLSDESKLIFGQFLNNIFHSKAKQNCQLSVSIAGCLTVFVHLTGIVSDNGKSCFVTLVDVTESKRIDDERKFLLASVDNSNDFIVVKDLDLRIVAASPSWLRIAGYTNLENVKGKTDAEVWGKSVDEEPVRTYMEDDRSAQKLLQGEFIQREEMIYLPSGEEIIVQVKKYPIFDSFGNLFCTGSISTDITEIKHAEEELRESEMFLKQTQQIARLGSYILDIKSGQWISSEILDNIFGINSTFERTIESWTSMLHPDWRNTMSEYFENEVIAKKGRFDKEYKIVRQIDQEERWVHGLGELEFDENNQAVRMIGTIRDITERKQIDKENRYLLALIENTSERVVVKDLDLKIVAANKSWIAGRGLTSLSEIVGKTDAEAFGVSADVEPVRTYMEDELKAQKLPPGEFLIRELPVKLYNKEDSVALVKRFPIFDETGKLFCTGTIATDITQRKRMEDALRKSEEKYRTVADYTYDWEFWIDENDKMVYCSPSCEKLTGYKSIDFLNNSQLLFDIIYPDDLRIFKTHNQRESKGETLTSGLQFRIIRADGTVRWIEHVCRPVYSDSCTFMGVRGSNRDITERKKTEQQLKTSENKYKLLSENITDGIFICRNGYLEYVNHSMCVIFGYEDTELEGMDLTDLIVYDYSGELEGFLAVKSPYNQSGNIELKCKRKDNTIIYVEILMNYISNEDVIYGVAHDVTEKRQIQKKNILKAILQTEEKERAYFSKELHDGLGPLLSTIKLYLQWSERKESHFSRSEIMKKASEILEEALTTVKEISFKLSPHLLTNYGLTSAVNSFANKIEETSEIIIDVKSNVERRLDMEVEIALYRAIIECINNTIKYAKANHIYITLHDSGSHIQLIYRDDGVGFDIMKALSDQKGLGLFNLQNRVQTIGGDIVMNSEPGRGVDYQIIVKLYPL